MTSRQKTLRDHSDIHTELQLIHQTVRHDVLNRLFYISCVIGNYQKFGDQTIPFDDLLANIQKMVKSSVEFIRNMETVEIQLTNNAPLQPIDIRAIITATALDFNDLQITVLGNGIVAADQAVTSVIANLFQNIRVHAGTKTVKVTIQENQSEVIVTVADRGKDIPDEIKSQLFQMGYAFGVTGNSGIGLYAVKTIMHRYGGRVAVADNHPHGAVFTLTFKNAIHTR